MRRTLKQIIGLALMALAFTACDDELAIDKARIDYVSRSGRLQVDSKDGDYQLSWERPEIHTNKGNAVVSGYRYEVCVVRIIVDINNVYEPETEIIPLKTTTGESAIVSINDVMQVLGGGDMSAFAFAIRLAGVKPDEIGVFCMSETVDLSTKVLIEVPVNPEIGYVKGGGWHQIGEVVELTATPNKGYTFVSWSDGVTDNPRTIIAETDIKLYAWFEEMLPLYCVYIYATDEKGNDINDFDARELIEIYSDYVPSEDDVTYYQVAGAYEYGQTALITVKDGNGYIFKGWSNGSTDKVLEFDVSYEDVYLEAYFETQNPLAKGYQSYNLWFLDGDNRPTGRIVDGNYSIDVTGYFGRDDRDIAKVWNDNFEVVFHGLENQIAGNEFLMEFDITWSGENETAGFRICSGVDNFIEGIPTYNTLTEEQVWDQDYNTELIFDDFSSRMGETFTVGSEGRHVQWGGTIGERGEDHIGIEINLSGIEKDGVIYENGPGTFTISNMRILINGEQVW